MTCESEQSESSVGEEGGVNDEETAGEVSEEQPGVTLGGDLLKHLFIFPGFHCCDLNNIELPGLTSRVLLTPASAPAPGGFRVRNYLRVIAVVAGGWW